MYRLPAVLAALSISAAACSFSSVDSDAPVHITGRALDSGGQGLAGTQVLLFKQADIGEVLFGAVLAVGSLSTVCFLPDPPALCRKARSATTDSAGNYEFDLTGKDTQGTLGTASTLNVVFAATDGTSSTTVSFVAEDEEISLPPARLWKSKPRVTTNAGSFQLRWSPLPAAAGANPTYSAQAYEGDQTSPLWTQSADGSSAEIDQRILEGAAGTVSASARTDLSGASGAGQVRASYLSKRLKVKSSSGTPASRGRPCAAVTGTAPARDARFTRCAATDGELNTPAHLKAAGKTVTGVTVDLGSARQVDLVVARGFSGQVVVEVSEDGKTYRIVATSTGTVAVDVPGSPRARFVRLRSPSGLDESLSAELSVW